MFDPSILLVPLGFALSAFAAKWLHYRLIWKIYRVGGAKDAVAVAKALRRGTACQESKMPAAVERHLEVYNLNGPTTRGGPSAPAGHSCAPDRQARRVTGPEGCGDRRCTAMAAVVDEVDVEEQCRIARELPPLEGRHAAAFARVLRPAWQSDLREFSSMRKGRDIDDIVRRSVLSASKNSAVHHEPDHALVRR
jgi:hypothetical protein